MISNRDNLSSARASRSFNRAISPRSSSASWWAAASRRCSSSISEPIGISLLLSETVGDTAVMARQPAAFQLSQSLQKSYTQVRCRVVKGLAIKSSESWLVWRGSALRRGSPAWEGCEWIAAERCLPRSSMADIS